MEIGIVARKGNAAAVELAAEIRQALQADGIEVRLDEATADALDDEGVPPEEMAACPFVVSVGGDGTFLYTARHVGSTPILGVNLGEVGFLNAVSPSEAIERVRDEVEHVREAGAPRYRVAPRVEARGEDWSLPPGLNEVVVQGPQRGPGGGIDVSIAIDGSEYASTHADGVIVATQTGSTAYNLSEGGPLVHPKAEGLVVNAMCPSDAVRPVVVGAAARVDVAIRGAAEAVVASDGSERRRIDIPSTIEVGVADEPARIAGPRSDFFEALEKIE